MILTLKKQKWMLKKKKKDDNDDKKLDENDNNIKLKEEKEEENNDIKNLIIPEVIYDDAINILKNNKSENNIIEEILLIHFGFLEKLEKYGTTKELNYQNLENKIINNIQDLLNKDNKNELFIIDNQIKIVKIKSMKYTKEDLLNKIKIIFEEYNKNLFIEKYINYYNYIAFHFLKYFLNEEDKDKNEDTDKNHNLFNDNEAYIEELIKIIKPKINIEKLDKEILLYSNIKLLVLISSKDYLISNLLIASKFDIYKKVFDYIKKIFEQNDLLSLKDIFIILDNLKSEIDSIVEKITNIQINFIENNDNCLNFLKYYIEKIIGLISDEMTYYIKPELMENYYEMICNQFEKGKINYILLKELYYKMIELIIDKCIQVNDNDKNEDGKKYYENAYKYIKKRTEKFLINGKSILEEIINKKTKNNKNDFTFLKWIE